MEHCPLPIELCEAVIDKIPWPIRKFKVSPHFDHLSAQRTLCACALTCRAWRTLAQRLLWSYVYLKSAPVASAFASASRTAPEECKLLLSALYLGEEFHGPLSLMSDDDHPVLDMATLNDLFMLHFPNLRTLHCTAARFNLGPGILRMRLPFFASCSLDTLLLESCIFDSARAFLDLVWAFPNLSHLFVTGNKLRRGALTPAGAAHLASVGKHLRAGRRLTSMHIQHVRSLDFKRLTS